MSAASSNAKSWLLPVVTATYGYALTQGVGSVALLGMAGVCLFALLDANYLRQEQAYRRLYNAVAQQKRPLLPFTMDPFEVDDSWPGRAAPSRLLVWAARWLPRASVWLSWSIAPFYGGLLLVGLLVAIAT